MTTNRANITIDCWEQAARQSTFAAAIHPSGAAGVEDPAWRESGEVHAAAWTAAWWRMSSGQDPTRVLGGGRPIVEARLRILDFGCGAGRVAVPLARMWPMAEIVCADASPTMLRRLAEQVPPAGVTTLLSDGFDGRLPQNLDAVHSMIVLQHYPWAEGAELLRRLIVSVRQNGLVGVQLPLYTVEGQSKDWTGVTTWTYERLYQTAADVGAVVVEAVVNPGMFVPGSTGPHHGAYHWIRRL